MNRVISDLALGVRLAVGGSRKSWVRLALQGFGIGMCVAVLLLAASIPAALDARTDRINARNAMSEGTGTPPLLVEEGSVPFRSDYINGIHVRVLTPGAPKPPGVERLPNDGEIVVSPALAALLSGPDGYLLRPRFPQQIIGTIAGAGLDGPRELRFVAGDSKIVENKSNRVYGYGNDLNRRGMAPILWLLSLVGVVVLLFPVLVFVGVATRLAAAQRDRRLAALRLVGAGATRVRLIASGEALVGALVGLVVGFGLLFAVRPLADDIAIPQLAAFPGDITPTIPLTLVVVIAVPVLAVLTSLFAMRRTIIEPLGVVREQKPVRRRLWWRLVPAIAGAALLASQFGKLTEQAKPDQWPVVLGVVFLMLGIPVLLPWLVEHVVYRMRGGSPALQLAVRRLQLDAGTAARVVGGVAVVLAGTVTLQMILAGVEHEVLTEEKAEASNRYLAVSTTETADVTGLQEALARGKGVLSVQDLLRTYATLPDNGYVSIAVGSCEALKAQANITNCADGKAYLVPFGAGETDARTGDELKLGRSGGYGPGSSTWTVPALEQVTGSRSGIYLTPSAASTLKAESLSHEFQAELDLTVPDVAEHARNAIAAYSWRANTYFIGQNDTAEIERMFLTVRRALYGGSLITLLLAGASLLVVALEQVRERRRPLAVMAASGVPRGTLARSLLWQNAVPLALSVVVSVGTGIGLGVLVMRVFNSEVAYDWAGIAVVTGVAVALMIAVTALTLPSLRRATGALGLRTE